MLKTPAEFPHPGSYAIHRRNRVRIIQRNKDGTLLISRGFVRHNRVTNITRRVPLAELTPARTSTALQVTANGVIWALAAIGAFNFVELMVR